MHTVSFATLGCKLNQYETEWLREQFRGAGYRVVPFGESADVCVVNTCTVTGPSDRQSRQLLYQARRRSPHGMVVATGCYAQVDPEQLIRMPVDLVVGTGEKERLLELVEQRRAGGSALQVREYGSARSFHGMPISGFSDRSRAFIKIQDGCDGTCSYCIVPFARGPSRSRPLPDVMVEARRLAEAGFQEVVLTGVHIGAYGRDLSPPLSLTAAVEQLEQVEGLRRFRLSSVEPMDWSPGWVERLECSQKLCRHLHIPLQSGDDEILRRMNRRYTVLDYERLVRKLHDRIPGIAIGADVIAGFPGETEAHFDHTYQMIHALPLAYLHVFPFSVRKGTAAARMRAQVDQATKRRRVALLRTLGEEKRKAFYSSSVGGVLSVLFEHRRDPKTGWLKGLSDNYIRVIADGPDALMGRIVPVRVEGIVEGEATVRGRVCR